MAIFDEILQLSNKYSNQLDLQINTRMNEMKFDDISHIFDISRVRYYESRMKSHRYISK